MDLKVEIDVPLSSIVGVKVRWDASHEWASPTVDEPALESLALRFEGTIDFGVLDKAGDPAYLELYPVDYSINKLSKPRLVIEPVR